MRKNIAIVVCGALLAGVYWFGIRSNEANIVVANPKLERKMARMKDGNPKAGYPGEAMQWYFAQRAHPAGSIPDGWKERALEHIQVHNRRTSETAALSWSEVGPANIGGRLRSVVVHPTNASILYAGSVSGGVFKSTNAGTSWFPCDDFAANLAIGALAIDPSNPNIVYAGTGEGFFNADAIRGAGVLKSTNGGTSWTLQTNFTGGSFPYYINSLYLRPDNPQIIYAATNTGLFRTTNGGTNWTFLHQGSSQRATQIVPHPTDALTFYVSYGNFSTDGIYRTTNGGTSFAKLTTGLPASGYTRISLAISPSNPLVLYAVFNGTNNFTRGIFRSTNGGTNWDSLATPTDALSGASHLAGQGWYNNVISVDPTNSNIVYAGGVNLYKSTTGGSSWTMLSNWYPGAGYPYVHADQHALVWSGSTLYIGNDGGVFRTTNGGTSFTELNNNLATIQFYSGAVHPTQDIYYGGTQDNGTLKSGVLPNWSMVFGGDGGEMAVDYNTPATVYTEYVYLNIQKSTNSGTTWTKTMNGIPQSGAGQFDGTSDRCLFIAPITMDPTNPVRLAAGTYRVFYTTNGGANWSSISSDLTGDGAGSVGQAGSTVSAIAVAKTNAAIIYIGTSGSGSSSSRIQVTTNTGSAWSNVTALPLPNRYVRRIIIDPNNADNAWALYSGYTTNTPVTPGHVFRTTNRGALWTNVSGNLPDIPVNAGVVNPSNINNIIIGTDLGAFETTNGGITWTQENSGLANVSIADMDLRAGDKILFAATHGRGMFKTTGPLTSVGEEDVVASEFRLLQNYPNPFNPETTIPFELNERSDVVLSLYDITGRHITTVARGMYEAGTHSVVFNASGLASGTYVYELRAGSRVSSRTFVVLK